MRISKSRSYHVSMSNYNKLALCFVVSSIIEPYTLCNEATDRDYYSSGNGRYYSDYKLSDEKDIYDDIETFVFIGSNIREGSAPAFINILLNGGSSLLLAGAAYSNLAYSIDAGFDAFFELNSYSSISNSFGIPVHSIGFSIAAQYVLPFRSISMRERFYNAAESNLPLIDPDNAANKIPANSSNVSADQIANAIYDHTSVFYGSATYRANVRYFDIILGGSLGANRYALNLFAVKNIVDVINVKDDSLHSLPSNIMYYFMAINSRFMIPIATLSDRMSILFSIGGMMQFATKYMLKRSLDVKSLALNKDLRITCTLNAGLSLSINI